MSNTVWWQQFRQQQQLHTIARTRHQQRTIVAVFNDVAYFFQRMIKETPNEFIN